VKIMTCILARRLNAPRPGYRTQKRDDKSRDRQRDFAVWRALIDLRLAQLWPDHSCESVGIVDVDLVWRWLEDQSPAHVAAQIVLENRP
jgi:hypothetical protein